VKCEDRVHRIKTRHPFVLIYVALLHAKQGQPG
jgi:hypothetical protein